MTGVAEAKLTCYGYRNRIVFREESHVLGKEDPYITTERCTTEILVGKCYSLRFPAVTLVPYGLLFIRFYSVLLQDILDMADWQSHS